MIVCISYRFLMLVSYNLPLWEYLHHGNRQKLEHMAFFSLGELVAPICKHTTAVSSLRALINSHSSLYILLNTYGSLWNHLFKDGHRTCQVSDLSV